MRLLPELGSSRLTHSPGTLPAQILTTVDRRIQPPSSCSRRFPSLFSHYNYSQMQEQRRPNERVAKRGIMADFLIVGLKSCLIRKWERTWIGTTSLIANKHIKDQECSLSFCSLRGGLSLNICMFESLSAIRRSFLSSRALLNT